MSGRQEPTPPSPNTTLADARHWLRHQLTLAGIDTAQLDSRFLLSWATGLSCEELYAAPDLELSAASLSKLESALEQRRRGMSVARITGRRAFWTLDLALSPATLEPRPETEHLVEHILNKVTAQKLLDAPLCLVDVGVGSGAILLALLSELPNAWGVGIDLSHAALQTAHHNASRLGLEKRCHFVQGDYVSAFSPEKVDIFVSNPPYISSSHLTELDDGVRRYDPKLALDGGPTGLEAYTQMISALKRFGLPRLGVWFEIGFDQKAAVMDLVTYEIGALVGQVTCHQDLALLPRCLEILPRDLICDEIRPLLSEKTLGKGAETG